MDNILKETIIWVVDLLKTFLGAFSPLFIGLILAYLLNPLVLWFKRKHLPPVFSAYMLVFILIASLLYAFTVLILGALPKGSLPEVAETVRLYFIQSYNEICNFIVKVFPSESVTGENSIFSELLIYAKGLFSPSSIGSVLTHLAKGLVNIFLGIMVSIYFLKDKEYFLALGEKFFFLTLKQKAHGLLLETMSQINNVIITFIKGAIVDSIVVAFLSSLVLTIISVNYSVVIGLLTGILNIIPYFGPFFAMLPAFAAGFVSGGISKAALTVILLFLVQQLDSNIIYPKIVGSATGLHPLFVLVSVAALGSLWGIVGMLIAVPIAGIIQILIQRWGYSKV